MNPLLWKREHLVAGGITTFIGAAAGMFFSWVDSPFSRGADIGTLFTAWLHYPMAYGPWVVGGAIAGGLAYYAFDLLTGSN